MADLDDEDENKDQTIADYLAKENAPSPVQAKDYSDPNDSKTPEAQALFAKVQADNTDTPAPAGSDIDAKSQVLKDYLSKQFAAASDDSGVKTAKDKASYNNTVANIGEALEGLFKSNSMAHGGAGVNTKFYQGIRDQGQQGVQQATADRQAKINSFIQSTEMNRQVAQDMMTRGTYDQQQKAAKFLNDSETPTSQASQNAQKAFRATFEDVPGLKDLDVSNYSVSDLQNLSKNADLKMKGEDLKATKGLQMAILQGNQATKNDVKQAAVYTQAAKDATTARGNPAFQQSQVAIQNGEKALDIINRYPDPNQMPPDQASLLNQEMGKMASGGVASEHGQRTIEANTLGSNWARFKQSITGEPTGAQLAPFIAQNKAYVEAMMKTAQNNITKHELDTYKGVRARFSPEQDAQWKQDFPAAFQAEQAAAAASASKAPQSASNTPAPATQHPEADQALQWAKSHPDDPRSKAIMQRLGVMNAGL